MDGILSDGRVGKLWMCKKMNGHALGIVVNDKNFVDRLLLFRSAVAVGETRIKTTIVLPPVEIIGEPEGTMRDVRCNVCGSMRTWWIDVKRVAVLLSPLYGSNER